MNIIKRRLQRIAEIIERRELDEMPFDHEFTTEYGKEFCHATGYEVLFENDPIWWNEYIDSEGCLHYGN